VNAIPDAVLGEGDKKRVVDGLIGRRGKMRDAMRGRAWLT